MIREIKVIFKIVTHSWVLLIDDTAKRYEDSLTYIGKFVDRFVFERTHSLTIDLFRFWLYQELCSWGPCLTWDPYSLNAFLLSSWRSWLFYYSCLISWNKQGICLTLTKSSTFYLSFKNFRILCFIFVFMEDNVFVISNLFGLSS
jgi:hypothetical protein